MINLPQSASLNLRDHTITIGGKDFPWTVGDNISVKTMCEGTESIRPLRRLRIDVFIEGDVTIEGDPRPEDTRTEWISRMPLIT